MQHVWRQQNTHGTARDALLTLVWADLGSCDILLIMRLNRVLDKIMWTLCLILEMIKPWCWCSWAFCLCFVWLLYYLSYNTCMIYGFLPSKIWLFRSHNIYVYNYVIFRIWRVEYDWDAHVLLIDVLINRCKLNLSLVPFCASSDFYFL